MINKVTLYGSNISYFTGKMENYFRVRRIPYEFKNMQFPAFEKEMEKNVGVMQMPAVVLSDGRWMTDTTKMIQWFENEINDNKIIPRDPLQAFFCFLLEDWADEWWWRTAMHYRWHYSEGARFASWHLANENLSTIPLPVWIKRRFIQFRQRSGYTTGDGITKENIKAVEEDFKNLLSNLDNIFSSRKFLLGEDPTLADIGFSGPFFRHFALDPVPLEIIKQQYPHVLNWVYNLWNAKITQNKVNLVNGIPDDLYPLLNEVGRLYLPYLNANVNAVKKDHKFFDVNVGDISFKKARYSRYRVWCLSEIRNHYNNLDSQIKERVKKILVETNCWSPMWSHEKLPLLKDQDKLLPFYADTKMIGVNEPKK